MTTTALPHPLWCVGTEPADQDHVSATLHAAEPTDLTGIRLRLQEMRDEDYGIKLTLLCLEFIEDDETTFYPLALSQAEVLWSAIGELLGRAGQECAAVNRSCGGRPYGGPAAPDNDGSD